MVPAKGRRQIVSTIKEPVDQLQSCPLCGSGASYVEEIKAIHIRCDGCGLKTPSESSFDPKFELEQTRYWSKRHLRDKWNQRDGGKTITTKFLVQTRAKYADEHKNMTDRWWGTRHSCEYPVNPQWPQEYIAKKLGRDYLQFINAEPELTDACNPDYDDFDEDQEPEYYPKPVFMEYRIVRVTKIKEVIEYGNTKAMGPVVQKDPDLDDARRKEAEQEKRFQELMKQEEDFEGQETE
jgi:hypothetical protein